MERHQRMVLQQGVRAPPVGGRRRQGLERVRGPECEHEEEERHDEPDQQRPRDERIGRSVTELVRGERQVPAQHQRPEQDRALERGPQPRDREEERCRAGVVVGHVLEREIVRDQRPLHDRGREHRRREHDEHVPASDPEEDGDVEVADVPAREDVGVRSPEVREEAREGGPLVGDDLDVGQVGEGPGRRRERVGVGDNQEHPVAAGPGRGDRVEAPAVRARLDVEGEDPEAGDEVVRGEPRVAVDPTHPGSALPRAVGHEAPADPVVDQVAIREADVSLEAFHSGGVEPAPERRHVAGPVDLDPPHRLARERDEHGRGDARRRLEPPDLVGRDAGDEEVG